MPQWMEPFTNIADATYSFIKMMQILVDRDDMSFEEAEEYIMYNCEGAWMGELTPIILHEYYDPWKE